MCTAEGDVDSTGDGEGGKLAVESAAASEGDASEGDVSEGDASDASESDLDWQKDENREKAILNAVLKMQSYLLTAWKWHCSMIEGGAYESEVVQQSNSIIKAHSDDICKCMKSFVRQFIEVPTKSKRVCIVPAVSTVLVGCFAFQGGVLHVNSVANMNAPNLTTFREMFTSTIGPYLGSSNRTWHCFFWPIQVAAGFGNFVLSTKEGNVPYWVKPNSSGLDTVLVPTLLGCRKLFQVRMKTPLPLSQAM
eukprot:585277-Rhodomonas_salina.1